LRLKRQQNLDHDGSTDVTPMSCLSLSFFGGLTTVH
jgi:hypothetical protein